MKAYSEAKEIAETGFCSIPTCRRPGQGLSFSFTPAEAAHRSEIFVASRPVISEIAAVVKEAAAFAEITVM
jgi:hypothetical protein